MKTTASTVVALALLAAGSLAWGDDDALRAIGQGRAIYLQLCASCHGPHGEGSPAGTHEHPLAVPDLTRIQERDGHFDRVHVAVHIEGRHDGLPSTTAMPCWSTVLRDAWPGGEAAAMLKIWKLARYVDFIQRRSPLEGESTAPGR